MAMCGSCGGNAAKKLSLINKAGTSSGNVAGIGIGAGGIGAGAGKTSNTTSLASDAAYQEPESSFESFTTWGFVVIVFGVGYFADSWGVAFTLAILWIFIRSVFQTFGWDTKGDAEKEKARSDWENTWMCTDCGHQWIKKQTGLCGD